MKEIYSVAYNYIAQIPSKPSDKIAADIEVSFIITEPEYTVGNDGNLIRSRKADTIRFLAQPETLRKMAAGFIKAAEECETNLSAALQVATGSAPD